MLLGLLVKEKKMYMPTTRQNTVGMGALNSKRGNSVNAKTKEEALKGAPLNAPCTLTTGGSTMKSQQSVIFLQKQDFSRASKHSSPPPHPSLFSFSITPSLIQTSPQCLAAKSLRRESFFSLRSSFELLLKAHALLFVLLTEYRQCTPSQGSLTLTSQAPVTGTFT